MINNVFVFIPVRTEFLSRALATLYKYTDMRNNRVVVVDQTKTGLYGKVPQKVHLWLKPYRNLGFSKGMNEGIIHGLRWGAKYITCCNDDIEFINKDWWDGILETFKMGDNVYGVNPESPRIPLWGYGRPHGEYIDIIKYKKKFSRQDYQYLLEGNFEDWQEKGELVSKANLPASFPLHKRGVTDAIAIWATVFKRECFERFGLFDEKFYPGAGEDYDFDARVYREKGRLLGTTKSWVWHWWGQSKDLQTKVDVDIDDGLRWNDLSYLYPPEKNFGQSVDPWGKVKNKKGEKVPVWRIPTIHIVDI